MPESIDARCDECGKYFKIKEFKTEQLSHDIEKTYFNCSHCDHEYIAFYTNKKIRMMQAEARVLADQASKAKTQKQLNDGLKRIEKKRQSIKVEMDMLRNKMKNA